MTVAKMPSCVAVLGGGITGLSTAYHLARRLPASSRIVVLEKENRVGGWVQSKRVRTKHGALEEDVVVESGPRTLRPNGKALLELVNLLGLKSSLLKVPKTHAAARARYLFLPPLTLMPNSIASLLSSPFTPQLRPMLPALLGEPFRRANRPAGIQDESIDSFFSRRFGSQFARMFGSALLHGIFAADSRKLSVLSIFPSMWDAEEAGHGRLSVGLLERSFSPAPQDNTYELGTLGHDMRDVSVYTFDGGLETVTHALKEELGTRPNVEVRTGVDLKSLQPTQDGAFQLISDVGPLEVVPDRIVSTVPTPFLQDIIAPPYSLPYLTSNPWSTVHLISFIFPPSNTPLHPAGFGYLIPRPASGYPTSPDSHSDAILGVVFDSAVRSTEEIPFPPFTRLTVMMGGPFAVPSTPPNVPAILDRISSHLGRRLPEPLHASFSVQKNCIPTYTVGHPQRMEELRKTLAGGPWGGRLEVIGASVNGVSVGDCVEIARRTAIKLAS